MSDESRVTPESSLGQWHSNQHQPARRHEQSHRLRARRALRLRRSHQAGEGGGGAPWQKRKERRPAWRIPPADGKGRLRPSCGPRAALIWPRVGRTHGPSPRGSPFTPHSRLRSNRPPSPRRCAWPRRACSTRRGARSAIASELRMAPHSASPTPTRPCRRRGQGGIDPSRPPRQRASPAAVVEALIAFVATV